MAETAGNITTGVQRGDSPSRALARIIVVADMFDGQLPPAMLEALTMGRAALQRRDTEFTNCVLIVPADRRHDEALQWVLRHARPGAACLPVIHPSEIALRDPPLTVVLLDGAEDRDDWPEMAAEIAVLGAGADVIRERRRG